MRLVILALSTVLFFFPVIALSQTLRVDEVLVEGNRRVEKNAVLSVLTVKPGESVSAEEIDANVRSIYKLGRFSDVSAHLQQDGDEYRLVFRVFERPLVRRVLFTGNDEFERNKLEALSSIKTPDLYNPRELAESVEAIRQAYKEEGYYAVLIDTKVDIDDDNEAVVTFDIKEGEKVLIRDIRFHGNTVFTDKQLKKAMETKEKWFFSWLTGRGTYRDEVLQNDLEIIADKYYNVGYVQNRVKQPLLSLNDDKTLMDIYIEIEEGDQFKVGKIDIKGDMISPKDELLDILQLKEGDVFSRETLRNDITALSDLYADQGYAYVNVAPITSVEPQERKVDITYDVEQGIQVTIDRINIRGNTKTRDKVIRREIKLVEGDIYHATRMKESRRRINNLGFFDEVNVSTVKGTDESKMDLDVEVKERPTGTFSVGFGYSSVDGFIGQGSVTQENFLGRALKLNLSGSFGGKSSTYQIGLTDPYFLDHNLTVGFDVYKTDREYSDFSKKTNGGDIKLGFPVTDNTRAFFVYRYEEKEIYDVDPLATQLIRDQEGRSTLSSITASLNRNTTDYRLDPSRGTVSEISIEYAGLGGTQKFAKYIADHRQFFPFKWNTVFSLHGQIGYAQKVGGEEIPIDERFFLGGINTLRGFDTREVGPKDPTTGEFIGGTKEAYFNAEYVFPILKEAGLKGVLFFDTGNSWSEDQDYFSSMRYSTGAGIRWFSPMGPLRLEWGYNLDPEEDEDRSKFEFTIGRVF